MPELAGGIELIIGFGKVEVNELGPDQLYETPPLTDNCKERPSQILVLLFIAVTGAGIKMIEAVATAVQPRALPVTVYCWVLAGLAIITLPVGPVPAGVFQV